MGRPLSHFLEIAHSFKYELFVQHTPLDSDTICKWCFCWFLIRKRRAALQRVFSCGGSELWNLYVDQLLAEILRAHFLPCDHGIFDSANSVQVLCLLFPESSNRAFRSGTATASEGMFN